MNEEKMRTQIGKVLLSLFLAGAIFFLGYVIGNKDKFNRIWIPSDIVKWRDTCINYKPPTNEP